MTLVRGNKPVLLHCPTQYAYGDMCSWFAMTAAFFHGEINDLVEVVPAYPAHNEPMALLRGHKPVLLHCADTV